MPTDTLLAEFELLARRQAFKGGHAVRNEMERLAFRGGPACDRETQI
jgi:hypothetical protein